MAMTERSVFGSETRSIEERENLMKDAKINFTGFKVRPIEKLARKRLPKSSLDIECSHILRTDRTDSTHMHQPLEYKLWLEAGKHTPPFPDRPDNDYNSNVWRNFRKSFGFSTSAEDRTVTEMIATMYPVNMPKPSNIGKHSLDKYLLESQLFLDERRKASAIRRTRADLEEMKRLKAYSEARNPPIDANGNILPPANFNKNIHRYIPPDYSHLLHPEPTNIPPDAKPDIFGSYVPNRHKYQPKLWKMSYKLNNPEYEKVQAEVQKRKTEEPKFAPVVTTARYAPWKSV